MGETLQAGRECDNPLSAVTVKIRRSIEEKATVVSFLWSLVQGKFINRSVLFINNLWVINVYEETGLLYLVPKQNMFFTYVRRLGGIQRCFGDRGCECLDTVHTHALSSIQNANRTITPTSTYRSRVGPSLTPNKLICCSLTMFLVMS